MLASFDEDTINQLALNTTESKTRTSHSGNKTSRRNEADRSQMGDGLSDSYLVKVLSRKDGGTRTTNQEKSTASGRAPKRPIVCIPCKKRFNRRSKLDQHNRLVHNADIRYSCDECHKTFSRRDHIARHVRNGHCLKQSQQATAGDELNVKTEDNQLLVELSMFINSMTRAVPSNAST